MKPMENNEKLFESLLDKATEYTKTSIELFKLKAIDKTSDIVSSLIPHYIVFFLIASFMLLLSIGLAFWLGEILDNVSYGFYVVAAFYGILGIIIHFMHKCLKKLICNYIIKMLFK
jgi:hypothetical protein